MTTTSGWRNIEPIAVAAYIKELSAEIAEPSAKQHLAVIRQLFDYLVMGGALVASPAALGARPQVRDHTWLNLPGKRGKEALHRPFLRGANSNANLSALQW
jgi:site-specific recombinase XerD